MLICRMRNILRRQPVICVYWLRYQMLQPTCSCCCNYLFYFIFDFAKLPGDSLCYAFIGFDTDKASEDAYFKMNNVLIDDRRIKARLFENCYHKRWRHWRGTVVVILSSSAVQRLNPLAFPCDAAVSHCAAYFRSASRTFRSARPRPTCGASPGPLALHLSRLYVPLARALSSHNGVTQVDFSQSVSHLWRQFKAFGSKADAAAGESANSGAAGGGRGGACFGEQTPPSFPKPN